MSEKSELKNLAELPEALDERIKRFHIRMLRFHDYSWKAHRRFFWANFLVVICGLAVAPSITIAALLEHNLAAGILGGTMTFLLGIQNAFKLGEHARHWEIMHNKAKIIRTQLESSPVRDEVFLDQLQQTWSKLRTDLMDGLPEPARIEDRSK